MRFDELILARRSVRQYQPKAVEPSKLQALIEAVRLSPSASNSQPWKLILVDDPAIRVTARNNQGDALIHSTEKALNEFGRSPAGSRSVRSI